MEKGTRTRKVSHRFFLFALLNMNFTDSDLRQMYFFLIITVIDLHLFFADHVMFDLPRSYFTVLNIFNNNNNY